MAFIVTPALLSVLSLLLLVVPRLAAAAEQFHAFGGHEVTLICKRATQDPVIQVIWSKIYANGDEVTVASRADGSNYQIDDNVQLVWSSYVNATTDLRFKSPSPNDGGTYTCTFLTRKGGSPVTVELMVHEPPRLSVPAILLDDSAEVKVTCTVPRILHKPRLTWELSNKSLERTAAVGDWVSEAVLNQTRALHGQNLSCIVEFPDLNVKVSESMTLDVKYMSLTVVAPELINAGQDGVNLTCVADSNPAPNIYSWTFPNDSGRWVEKEHGAVVAFSEPVSTNQTGLYQCHGKNGYVNSSSPLFQLTVQPQPDTEPLLDNNIIYLLAGVVGALLLLILVLVIVCRKGKPTNPYLDDKDSTPIHKPAPPKRLPEPQPNPGANVEMGLLYAGPVVKPKGRSPRPARNPLAFSYLDAPCPELDSVSATRTDPEDYDDVEVI